MIAFRRWLARWGGPDWEQLLGPAEAAPAEAAAAMLPPMPALLSERQLDRYHQHTLHCRSCRGALRSIRRLQGLAWLLAVLALALAALLPDALRWPLGGALVLLALAALGLALALRWWLEPRFRYVPYDHTQR